MTAAQPPAPPPSLWLVALLQLVLLGAVWFVFGAARNFEFVDYDDHEYVFENQMIANGISTESVTWAFTRVHAGNWHPLTTISHQLDCQLFGLSAGRHHLTSIVIHALTTLLLFHLFRRFGVGLWVSVVITLVFAIHPLRVESVAWVSERKDVLSGLFFVLTLLAYHRYVRAVAALAMGTPLQPWRHPSYWAAAFCFALGLMSKPMLVTTPFVLLLLDLWPWRRLQIDPLATLGRRLLPLLREKIPFFALTLAACAATVWAQDSAMVPTDHLSAPARIANAVMAMAIYLGQLFWPVSLAALYPYPESGSFLSRAILSGVLLGAISVVAWRWRHARPFFLVGWLWYLGMLVPVVGLVQVGTQAHADRYTYLPHVGLVFAGVLALAEWSQRWARLRPTLIVLTVVALAALAWRARDQTMVWRNSESLWTATIANTEANPMARANWGASMLRAGRVDEAVAQLEAALAISPQHLTALNNLGLARLRQGDREAAVVCFESVLLVDPGNARARTQLALLAAQREGGNAQALLDLGVAVNSDPSNVALRTAYAQLLTRAGRFDEALAQVGEALRLAPHSNEARFQLAVALAARGRTAEAVSAYEELLRRQPEHAEANRQLGNLLLLRGQINDAIARYETALRLQPEQPRVHFNLGAAFAMQQRYAEAIAQFETVVRLEPTDAMAYKNLGLALARSGRRTEARQQLEQALQLKPDFAEARQALTELGAP